jgi:anthranilate synthase/aminodeoxychorismate synthase-like glutamine amidotransferase
MLLLLDNYDSFTYNLYDYLAQLGLKCKVFRNDISLEKLKKQDFRGVVLSPGAYTPKEANNLMQITAYYHDKIPILGICLGHQAIGDFFGATLVKAKRPMHGKLSMINCQKDVIFKNLPTQFNVVRYNSLLIENPNPILKIIAQTSSGEIMAIRHKELPIWGLQFHPEAALTEYGLEILKNFVEELG